MVQFIHENKYVLSPDRRRLPIFTVNVIWKNSWLFLIMSKMKTFISVSIYGFVTVAISDACYFMYITLLLLGMHD